MPTIDAAIEILKDSIIDVEAFELDPELPDAIRLGISALKTVGKITDMVDKLVCSASELGEVGVVTWLCALRTDITLLLLGETEK